VNSKMENGEESNDIIDKGGCLVVTRRKREEV
jgi:hypothetical protein